MEVRGDTVAISFEGVRKEYALYHQMVAGFKSFVLNLPRSVKSLRKSRFLALDGVSFDVKRGETLGIIGPNGSGKSTILSLMAGVLRQDSGSINVYGKVSSLLELGAGFHPELTGIENIILNGTLLGLTRRQIEERLPTIVEFSELGEFISQPVRTYSSGMYMRLGFSVAVHLDPDILLVDEIMSVGDIEFQEKCLSKMADIKASGVTIVFVSHEIKTVMEVSDRVLWIDGGRVQEVGEPVDVIKKYLYHIGYPEALDGLLPEDARERETAEDKIAVEPATWSWWEEPVVLEHLQSTITGMPRSGLEEFYVHLKKLVGTAVGPRRGLIIRSRLAGIERNFARYGLFRNFDVIPVSGDAPASPGDLRLGDSVYDLVVSIDVLGRMDGLDVFMRDLHGRLSENAVLFSIEFSGEGAGKTTGGGMYREFLDRFPEPYRSESPFWPPRAAPGVDFIGSATAFFETVEMKNLGGGLFGPLLADPDRGIYLARQNSVMLEFIFELERVLMEKGVLQSPYVSFIGRKKLP